MAQSYLKTALASILPLQGEKDWCQCRNTKIQRKDAKGANRVRKLDSEGWF